MKRALAIASVIIGLIIVEAGTIVFCIYFDRVTHGG